MLELLDPAKLDPIAFEQGLIDEIREYSLLDDKRIGWNYYMDYTWLAIKFADYIKPDAKVIDIGCGPGAVHGYLEDKYDVDIIGIDRLRWDKDYVDYTGDITNKKFCEQIDLQDHSVDMIISTSAFEHNSLKNHAKTIQHCVRLLKPGGVLLTTTIASNTVKKLKGQISLDRETAEALYLQKCHEWNYDEVWKNWKSHDVMMQALEARNKKLKENDPEYISLAATIEV